MSARKMLFIILTLALALRGVAAVIVTRHLESTGESFLIAGDAAGYWELGQHIARGEPYQLLGRPDDRLARNSIPRQVPRMPGFPALLGFSIWMLGNNPLAARLVLALVGTLACLLVYRLGSQLFSTRTGLLAASACAVSPTLAGSSVLILSDTLFAVLLLTFLLAVASLTRSRETFETRPRLTTAALAGLAGCAAVYVRPGWLPAIPLFALFWVVGSGSRVRAVPEAGILLLIVAIGLLPWTQRNWQRTGHPVLTTLWGGPSLYDGLHPGATGASDMQFIVDDGLYGDPAQTEYTIDQHYRAAAWDFVVSRPAMAARLAVIKVWRFLKPWPSAPQFQRWWQIILVAGLTVPLYLLAVRGAWLHRSSPWCWLLVAGPLLYFVVLHTVFVGSLRYRLPAEYSLWVLAAAGCRERGAP